MKKIIFILILISIYGCARTPEERRDRREQKRYEKDKKRFAYLLKIHSDFIDTTTRFDTVIVHDTATITVNTPLDSSGIDSLLLIYCDAVNSQDKSSPVRPDSIRERIVRQYIFKECEKINDGTYHLLDQNKDTVTVVLKGRRISVFQKRNVVMVTKTIVTPCPENTLNLWQDIKKNGLKWILIFIGGGITFLVIFRRR